MKKLKIFLLAIVALFVMLFIIGMLSGTDSPQESVEMQTEGSTKSASSETTAQTTAQSQTVTEPPVETETETETELATETSTDKSTSSNYTALEIYTSLQENGVVPYVLTEKAIQFLSDHDNLFPLNEKNYAEITDELIDYNIEAKHISKNDRKYGDKLMMIPSSQIIQIEETQISDNKYLSVINAIDYDGLQYYILYNGELDNFYDGDAISVTGLPLGYSKFDNTKGGQTFVVVVAGCLITANEPTG